ncbi:MAG: alpha/beta fold hydrolase [Acidimicrobiales bacterium]
MVTDGRPYGSVATSEAKNGLSSRFAPTDRYTHDGLTFDVDDAGPPDGRAVIALHGFPEDRQTWSPLSTSLVGAGYRVLAPDQRGYSPGARPAGRRAYTIDRLAGDVLALAGAAGADRFDLVGHDWGALVS